MPSELISKTAINRSRIVGRTEARKAGRQRFRFTVERPTASD